MTTTEDKRLFVGGLVKGVTEDELVEKFSRFGQVSSVEIKTRASETDSKSKTFAYLNLTAEENAFKKCFTAYNNTKWKGGQLKLQFAKESFLSKLKKEQAEAKMSQEKKESKPASAHKSPALEGSKKAVPGTPLDEKGTWVMGKFSRIQPVLRLKKPGSGKIVIVDPSKMTHSLKKLKSDDFDPEKPSGLTWQLEENTSDINKRRQGQFPAWEAPQHRSTPKEPAALKQGSLFSRLQGLAAEERVSDTEMEVVPVGKMETVSKTHAARGGYDSDDSAGSADTDEIVCKASGKKTPNLTAENCVTAAGAHLKKKKKKPVKSPLSGHADDSACSSDVATPSCKSSSKKTPDSLRNRKESQVKNKVDAKDKNAEEKHRPQFEFVKTPKLKGKALKKSEKLSHSEAPSVGNSFADEDSEVEDNKVKVPRTSGNKKPASMTPEFKGLGMLSSDSEDDVPPARSTEMGKSKGQSSVETTDAVKGAKAVSSLQKSLGKDVSSDSDDTDDILSGDKKQSVVTQKSLKEKFKKVSDSSKEHSETKGTKLVSHTQLQKKQQKKTVKNSQGTEKVSQNGSTNPGVSLAMSGASISELTDEFGDGLGTDTSLPTLQKKRKRSKPVSSDDSDLDDNDFEKVGRKLAARALQQDPRSPRTVHKGHQGAVPEDNANMTRKRTSQGEEGCLSAMQKSHQAYHKVQKKKKEEENLITKALREGTESKLIKFSDSEDEEMPSEVKPAKMSLFSDTDSDADSDSGSEVDFSLRPQFEGSKGKKLFELQSKIMDKRFRFDERFETDSEGDEGGESDNIIEQDSEDEMAGERERQLQILEKILGYKPRPRTRPVYEAMSKRRYDHDTASEVTIVPEAKPKERAMSKRRYDHDTASEVTIVPEAKPKERSEDESTEQDENTEQEESENTEQEESTEKTLKGLFGGGSSFTFFGSPDDEDDVDEPMTSIQVDEEVEKDEEEDDEEVKDRDLEGEMSALNGPRVPETDRLRPPVHQQPSFMVAKDDPRLIAAVKFFKRPHEEEFEELSERWAEERQKIMELVKERHKRALRKERVMKKGQKSRTFKTFAKTKKL